MLGRGLRDPDGVQLGGDGVGGVQEPVEVGVGERMGL